LEEALKLTQITGSNYQQIRALLALSSVAATEGQTTEAEQHASKAISLAQTARIENQATSGLIWLGNSFLVRGDYEEAEKYYQQGLQLARRDNGRRNEALALGQLGSLRSNSIERMKVCATSSRHCRSSNRVAIAKSCHRC